jgi:cell wall-associated NlpC family hydrolase
MEPKICVVPVMPLRAEPSHKSEMVSRLIFGECVVVLSQAGDWVKVRNQYDQYEGWAAQNQLTQIDEELYYEPTEEYTGDLLTTVSVSGHPMNITLGSFLKGMRHGEMHWGKVTVTFKGTPLNPDHLPVTEKLIRQFAFQFLNTPYLWGGRSVFGIDCSGFTQSIYRLVGKILPRDAYMQARCGEELKPHHKPRCGDLAFFKTQEGQITHVGLMLNDFEIIHSSGKVRVDKLDEKGILNADTGEHTHQLAMIRRFF